MHDLLVQIHTQMRDFDGSETRIPSGVPFYYFLSFRVDWSAYFLHRNLYFLLLIESRSSYWRPAFLACQKRASSFISHYIYLMVILPRGK